MSVIQYYNTKLENDMRKFETPCEFFLHYDKERRKIITIDDITALEERLRSTGHSVKVNKDGTRVVRTPEELVTAKNRRLAIQKKEAAKYTKLGAAVPIPLVHEFSDACKKLGVTQLEVLMPTIDKIIERAQKIDS